MTQKILRAKKCNYNSSMSLKMLRSSQQMSNKDKEKMLIKLTTKVLQNSRKASASPLVFLDTIRLYAP